MDVLRRGFMAMSLEKTAIEEDASVVGLYFMAGARDFTGCAVRDDLHGLYYSPTAALMASSSPSVSGRMAPIGKWASRSVTMRTRRKSFT